MAVFSLLVCVCRRFVVFVVSSLFGHALDNATHLFPYMPLSIPHGAGHLLLWFQPIEAPVTMFGTGFVTCIFIHQRSLFVLTWK